MYLGCVSHRTWDHSAQWHHLMPSENYYIQNVIFTFIPCTCAWWAEWQIGWLNFSTRKMPKKWHSSGTKENNQTLGEPPASASKIMCDLSPFRVAMDRQPMTLLWDDIFVDVLHSRNDYSYNKWRYQWVLRIRRSSSTSMSTMTHQTMYAYNRISDTNHKRRLNIWYDDIRIQRWVGLIFSVVV